MAGTMARERAGQSVRLISDFRNKNRRSEKYIEFIQKMAGPLANKVLHQNSTFSQKHLMGIADSAPISPSGEAFHGNDTYF